MIDWLAAGTLAWSYLRTITTDKIADSAKNAADDRVDKIFSELTAQLTTVVPPDNEGLRRAYRRSCLAATQHVCSQLILHISGENSPQLLAKPRLLVLGEIPTTVFGKTELEWLRRAETFVRAQVQDLDEDRTFLAAQSTAAYYGLVAPDAADANSLQGFQSSFTDRAIAEIALGVQETAPDTFVSTMREHWLRLVCDEFQHRLSTAPELTALFQNKLLVELTLNSNASSIQLREIIAPLPDLIESDGDKTRVKIDESTQRILDNLEQTVPVGSPIPLPVGFVGRSNYLKDLRESYEGGVRRFVLHGVAGVGKSATALQFANLIEQDFAATAFVNMLGTQSNPTSATDCMLEILRQLGNEMPSDTPENSLKNIFTQTANKQPTLIVLDNAEGKETVEQLIHTRACVIVTSRESFVITSGKSIRVEKMSPEDSVALLVSIAGQERIGDHGHILAHLADFLPMALKPLASILTEDPLETAASLSESYQDKQKPLNERVPDYDNLTIRASLELSFERLADEMQRKLVGLSVFPSDFNEAQIAFVFQIDPVEAVSTHKHLRRFSLLEVNLEAKRFHLHDIVRAFADSKLEDVERNIRNERFAKYFGVFLYFANPKLMKDYSKALRMLDVDWHNILAGQLWASANKHSNAEAAKLCILYAIASELTSLRLNPRGRLRWYVDGLTTAQMLKDEAAEANILQNLGIAYSELGEYKLAITHLNTCLKLARNLEIQEGVMQALVNLGSAHRNLGMYAEALEYQNEALTIALRLSDKSMEMKVRASIATILDSSGNHEKAIEEYAFCLEYFRSIGDRNHEAAALVNIGSALLSQGKLKEAGTYFAKGEAAAKEVGNLDILAVCYSNSATIMSHIGEHNFALHYFRESLKLSTELGDQDGIATALGGVAITLDSMGNYRESVRYQRQALALARNIGHRSMVIKALGNLGNAHNNLAEYEEAFKLHNEALKLARDQGDRSSEAINLTNLGNDYFDTGDKRRACEFWTEAQAIMIAIDSPYLENVRRKITENCG